MLMPRQRIITLLGLTSLIATMVTISRYSNNFADNSRIVRQVHVREIHSAQKDINTKGEHKLVIHNYNNNSFNIINKLRDHQSKLKVKIAKIDNQIDNHNQNNISPQKKPKISADSVVNNELNAINYNLNEIPDTPINDPIVPNESVPLSPPSSSSSSSSATSSSMVINSNSQSGVNNETPLTKSLPSNSNSNNMAKNLPSSSSTTTTTTSKPKIKLFFDLNDLKTTETMKIDKPVFCDTDHGANLDLLVVVTSATDHFEAREAIRSTWGKFAVERGAFLLFLLGSTDNVQLQEKIIAEDVKYGDILQGHFNDHYYNLTLKTIAMMKWIKDNCAMVKFVLKVDDDMFVNMQQVTDFSETRTFHKVIIGKLAKKWRPHRNPTNKWYVPMTAFNGTIFPNFATGPAYIITGDAAEKLYYTSIKLTPIYLEDVYMTGIVAEKAGIKRLNHALMRNVPIKIDACTFRKIMTSHKHNPSEIRRLWDLVYTQPLRPCDTNNKARASKGSSVSGTSSGSGSAPEKGSPHARAPASG